MSTFYNKSFAEFILEKNAGRHGEIALLDRNGERQTTWDEFRALIDTVAAYARKKGIKGIVPVCMDRSLEAFASLLGLNMAGAAVAPLSIDTPDERCRNISEQTANPVWTISTFSEAMEAGGISDSSAAEADQAKIMESVSPAEGAEGEKTGYVVFTSGSTGNPKGVMLSNNAVIKGMIRAAEPDCYDFREGDQVLQNASFSFVAFIIEGLAPFIKGAVVHVLPEASRGDIRLISEYVEHWGITQIFMPPQLYRNFEGSSSIKCVCTGSDRIINLAPKGHRLVGLYGLSETAVIAFRYEIKEPMESTPIGKPCDDFRAYVLDEEGRPAEEGELCLSGAVAQGYLNNPEKTAEAFVKNPFSDEPGHEVLLHTGDIVRRLQDGNYRYINRKDNMIKVNGQRVEPGEIEICMMEVEGVNGAVVKGFTDEEGRSILCGFYTAEPRARVDEDQIRDYLSERLTHYMVPSIYVKLDSMPLNANGKVNRKGLTMPDLSLLRTEYEAPETEAEEKLCQAFAKTLNIDRVGATDDFFRIGGDSIRAITVVSLCSDMNLTARDVMKGRTPRQIGANIAGNQDSVYKKYAGKLNDKSHLTDSQMGVYLQCVMGPESTMYNIPIEMTVEMPANAGLTLTDIKDKIDGVLAAHPALYARIAQEEEGVYMIRQPFPPEGLVSVAAEEICSSEAGTGSSAGQLIRPFVLEKGPLCRCSVSLDNDGNLRIFLDMHHLVSDGTSVNIICNQITDALNGAETAPEKIDAFALYEVEEELKSTANQLDNAEKYFEKLLAGEETDSNILPDSKIRDSGDEKGGAAANAVNAASFPAKYFKTRLELPGLTEKLAASGITENTFFMGVFGYVLAKMTGQSDSLFTAGESGRNSDFLDRTSAMMVRTLPVVMHIDEKRSGFSLLKDLQQQFMETMDHDIMSFAELAHKYGVRSEVAFVYQSDLLMEITSGDVRCTMEHLDRKDTFVNLSSSVLKSEGGYQIILEYRQDLYGEKTIERFAGLYERAAGAFMTGGPLCEMCLVSAEDMRILKGFCEESDAAAERLGISQENPETIPDIFRRHAKERPDSTAVVFKDKSYTYGQVDRITDRIAAYIAGLGIGREQTVSVLIPRCEYMEIATVGVLKAGAIYQPLDPDYPEERLSFMIEDADAKLLIADRNLMGCVSGYNGPVLYLDEIEGLPEAGADLGKIAPSPEDTYVLLYTSGTTGKPKGCRLTHANIMAAVKAYSDIAKPDSSSRFACYASYGFDAHMVDLYPAIYNGCQLHIIPQEIRLDFPALKEYIETNEISHTCMTTQVARQFALEYKDIKSLKFILTGGEKLASFTNNTNYIVGNFYGPSECTICVCGFLVDEKVYDNIPIGNAMAGNYFYIVDGFDRKVPVGVPGELIICGPQVGAGYLNRPEKTAEVFVPNTFDQNPDSMHLRCYRTGDIVRYLEDGNLEFIGRRDQQVKIRGFRIELSEVEDVIRQYPGIKDAVAVAVDISGGKALNAYFTASEKIDINSLNDFIREKKPAYMVPAGAMQIESIPMTTNQKVDKRKLPEIKTTAKAEGGGAERSLTALEKQLIAILEEIIGEGSGDVMTSLTDLGITSISSIRLSTLIYKKFGVKFLSPEILDDCNILKMEDRIIEELLAGGGLARQPGEGAGQGAGQGSSASEDVPAAVLTADKYPLTQTQMGIYLDSLRAGTEAYNIPLLLKLPDDIDIDRLKSAIKTTIKAHPSMLCGIGTDENGDVFMFPDRDMALEIPEETVDSIPPAFTEFAFDGSPLFSFRIIGCGGEVYLLMEIHHIIGDGESMTLLLSDIDKAYSGEAPEAELYTIFELSSEEAERRNGGAFQEAKAYYDSVFRGVSADYLPFADRDEETETALFHRQLGADPAAVKKMCSALGITENAFFTGVFGLMIARYTSHEDALFAIIYNGRIDPRTAALAAMLVKTMPIYLQTDNAASVADYLKSVSEQMKLLRKHDIFSFGDAAAEYGVNADVIFVYQGRMMSEVRLGGKVLEQTELMNDAPKAEISAELFENDESYSLVIEYNGGHYTTEWMDTFADAYSTCVDSILRAETLGQVDITSEREFARFAGMNDTYLEIPYRPVYRLVEEQADAHPDKPAVIARPERGKANSPVSTSKYEKITYAQLDNMANYAAAQLLEKGVEPGSVVGIITDRIKEIYVAEVGILKAGCAFIFLSPSYPDERIRYIMDEGQVKAVITTRMQAANRAALLKEANLPVILADLIDPDVKAERLSLDVDPESLAYIIYTSGSTGNPKGVTICQRNLINLANDNPGNIQMHGFVTDVSAAVAAFTFDASIIDGFCALANGATVCIAGDDDVHDPKSFSEFCLDNGVKSMVGTPSLIMSLLDYEGFEPVVAGMETILAGGEVFSAGLYDRLRSLNPDMQIINGYGPSETSVACTSKLLTSREDITIGKPLTNHRIYILDRMNHVLPMGALGELVIMGEGVGKGYRNREDLTKKVFVTVMGEPAYKSGDLALISHDEEIRFHGRIDNQIKLRGLRVELGEIESAINNCNGVKNCIVTVNGPESSRYLAAFYTVEKPVEKEEIIADISKTLTEYMVPRVFIQLDEMPMTANGKIDKKALPQPILAVESREYEAPANDTEQELAQAFARALGLEKVGVNDDFFELGGTSLSATKVAMYAMAHNIEIAYKDVFANPTVRKLSALVGTSDVPVEKNPFDVDYSLADKALASNIWAPGDDPGSRPVGNMLITGATGFLGIHVLREFLEKEQGDVYCLLRKGSFPSLEQKLEGMFVYYFDMALDSYSSRIHYIEGDITDEACIMGLQDAAFDTVFNCAANVKHFAKDDILEQVNVKGVENLVRLCRETGRRLIQVSTISVAGEGINGSPDRDFKIHENQLFFGQLLDNQYIISKFKAEKIVLDAVAEGLDAKIMRAGNLMPRYSDGEFQINHMTNGFMRRLHGYGALGCIPYSQLSAELEFSPIDETAAAMLALAGTDSRFTVFHTNNIHTVFMTDVVRAMNEAGIHVACVDENVFAVRMQAALSDPEHSGGVSGLIAYMNRDRVEDRYMLGYDNSFTASVLNRIGFTWNITDDKYISGALKQLEEFGFFDFDIE